MKKNINGGRSIIPKDELYDIMQEMNKIDPKIISHNFYEIAKERKKTNKFFKGRGKKDKSESSIDEFSDELNKSEKKISESRTEKKKRL